MMTTVITMASDTYAIASKIHTIFSPEQVADLVADSFAPRDLVSLNLV
jgi:hypothetical protein